MVDILIKDPKIQTYEDLELFNHVKKFSDSEAKIIYETMRKAYIDEDIIKYYSKSKSRASINKIRLSNLISINKLYSSSNNQKR